MPLVTDRLPKKYHDAVLAWQRRHFEDYPYLLEHWTDFYSQEPFDLLRVMAEEFRHGYQMIFLLACDDWAVSGNDATVNTIEELLEMETGGHVLDAFNVYFDSFVDNVVFAALIDRVGKYQLRMQKGFAYAPMARSMGPMLSEEAFHLVAGVGPLKEWVQAAARDEGNVSIGNIQRHINKWLPRGLEMFGDERGGSTNVRLGLKDLPNRQAVDQYYDEVRIEVIDKPNAEIIRARRGITPLEEAIGLAHRIRSAGEAHEGISPDDLLQAPVMSFFRRRGVHAFEMNDVNGRPISNIKEYLRQLRTALPEAYLSGHDFSTYVQNLSRHFAGETVDEGTLPFFG